jgi:16S rRNA (uracil1498-N3)-methyltransferase
VQLFYSTHIEGQKAFLDENESQHAKRVLRHKVGDKVFVCDGYGLLQSAIFTQIHDKQCVLEMEEAVQRQARPSQSLHLAFSPTKSADRIEWMMEKCVEIGIASFQPLMCHRTEKARINEERLQKILISAMKQSTQVFLPVLHPVQTFKDFVVANHDAQVKTIAHCMPSEKSSIQSQLKPSMLVCIGPEGDFTEEEVDLAMQSGFTAISLGVQRLRTETAALYACAQFNT